MQHNPAYSTIRKKKVRDVPSTPNPFIEYVRENYGSVRKQHNSHSDTMKILSEQFKQVKISNN